MLLTFFDFPAEHWKHLRMSLDFMDTLGAEVARVADDPGVRAIVIRGAGTENFSVGMDLKQLPEGLKRMGSLEALLDQRLRVLDAIENLPKPVVAVLYGYCAVLATMGTPDQREGIQAFLEKRRPRFNQGSE